MKFTDSITSNIKAVLAVLVVFASFTYFFVTYFFGKGQSDPQVIIAIVGAMTTVLAYYFGSSQGMAKANEQIAQNSANPVIGNSEVTNVKK